MPEGHLIHHYARRQRDGLVGAVTLSSPQGRFDARAVKGRLVDVEAYGKHLFHRWDAGAVVHIHLGMQGVFLDGPPPAAPPRPQGRMRVEGPRLVSDLIAPRICAVTDEDGRQRIIDAVGPDPLRPDADRDRVLATLADSSRAIGALLLDQTVIAGVGNALRADVLNLVGIHPQTPAAALRAGQLAQLWSVLVDVMHRSADAGSIDHMVYRLERCARCGTPVETPEVAGRTAYVCPRHQPIISG